MLFTVTPVPGTDSAIPAQRQSAQSWSFRSAPFRRNLDPRFARYEKDTAPVPFQHPCEIVSREPHSAHHVYLEEAYQSASGISANGFGSKMPHCSPRTSSAGSFAITASAPANQKSPPRCHQPWAAAACDRIAATAASTRSCVRPFT